MKCLMLLEIIIFYNYSKISLNHNVREYKSREQCFTSIVGFSNEMPYVIRDSNEMPYVIRDSNIL
jgi:hypothetical protein